MQGGVASLQLCVILSLTWHHLMWVAVLAVCVSTSTGKDYRTVGLEESLCGRTEAGSRHVQHVIQVCEWGYGICTERCRKPAQAKWLVGNAWLSCNNWSEHVTKCYASRRPTHPHMPAHMVRATLTRWIPRMVRPGRPAAAVMLHGTVRCKLQLVLHPGMHGFRRVHTVR